MPCVCLKAGALAQTSDAALTGTLASGGPAGAWRQVARSGAFIRDYWRDVVGGGRGAALARWTPVHGCHLRGEIRRSCLLDGLHGRRGF
jgi:hypothetical protein